VSVGWDGWKERGRGETVVEGEGKTGGRKARARAAAEDRARPGRGRTRCVLQRPTSRSWWSGRRRRRPVAQEREGVGIALDFARAMLPVTVISRRGTTVLSVVCDCRYANCGSTHSHSRVKSDCGRLPRTCISQVPAAGTASVYPTDRSRRP
jgi:hypothetical protein